MDTKCSCGKEGKERKPYLANEEEAERMKYYACDECFEATWAGEG